jgi:hypothetical protein
VDQPVAEPDDGAKMVNASLNRFVQAIRLVQGLADRDQMTLDRGSHDAILAESLRSDLFPDRDDLVRCGERVKQVDANLTLLRRTASDRG